MLNGKILKMSSFEHLPEEMLLEIFSYLSREDKIRKISVLNKFFRHTIQKYLWTKTFLNLNAKFDSKEKGLACIKLNYFLKTLNLICDNYCNYFENQPSMSEWILEAIKAPNLKNIILHFEHGSIHFDTPYLRKQLKNLDFKNLTVDEHYSYRKIADVFKELQTLKLSMSIDW